MTDLTVGLFVRDELGKLELISECDYDHFGVCPAVNDVICEDGPGRGGTYAYRVIERVFMDVLTYPGWALILEPIPVSKQLKAVSKEWAVSEDTERRLIEDERKEQIEGSWDELDRLLSKTERSRYPKLYPTESELLPRRSPLPEKMKLPIHPPLQWMEKKVLNALLEKPLAKIPTSAIHGTGPATVKALVARGYIEVAQEGSKRSRRTLVSLTEKAINDIEAEKSLRRKYLFHRSH